MFSTESFPSSSASSSELAIIVLDKNQHQIDANLPGIIRSSSLSAVPPATYSACFSLSLSLISLTASML
ncbi:hypothetical protein BHM03_00019640 [Ensete ventricosum]|nr:hypothetical protein BHM03_00019640 [Ensete ventricosum]